LLRAIVHGGEIDKGLADTGVAAFVELTRAINCRRVTSTAMVDFLRLSTGTAENITALQEMAFGGDEDTRPLGFLDLGDQFAAPYVTDERVVSIILKFTLDTFDSIMDPDASEDGDSRASMSSRRSLLPTADAARTLFTFSLMHFLRTQSWQNADYMIRRVFLPCQEERDDMMSDGDQKYHANFRAAFADSFDIQGEEENGKAKVKAGYELTYWFIDLCNTITNFSSGPQVAFVMGSQRALAQNLHQMIRHLEEAVGTFGTHYLDWDPAAYVNVVRTAEGCLSREGQGGEGGEGGGGSFSGDGSQQKPLELEMEGEEDEDDDEDEDEGEGEGEGETTPPFDV